jgi:hypothetical protein
MSADDSVDVVLAFMRAFQEQDRTAAEALMADDFDSPGTTLQTAEVDGQVFHRYEYAVDGTRYRNMEATRVEHGRVREVEVYFGGAV